MSRNLVNYLILGQFLTYLQNWFLLSNLISECLHTLIRCTKIFIKFLFQDKKWTRLQYCNFLQYQHIFAVARWNHPYARTNQKHTRKHFIAFVHIYNWYGGMCAHIITKKFWGQFQSSELKHQKAFLARLNKGTKKYELCFYCKTS